MGQWKAFAQFGIYLKICCSLPEQRKGIFDLDLCWLAVNLQGSRFNHFVHIWNQTTTGVSHLYATMVFRNHFN